MPQTMNTHCRRTTCELRTNHRRLSSSRQPAQRHAGRLRISRAQSPSGQWETDDIKKLVVEDLAAGNLKVGDAWQYVLPENLHDLYEDVVQAEERWHAQVDEILKLPKYKQAEAYFQNVRVEPEFASEMVGMGTWRLKKAVDPIISAMTGRIEGLLFTNLMMELNLYPPHKWKGRFDFVDSIDPKREWDNWAWADIPDPLPETEDYPRMYLENRIYCSRVFRKIHIEVAARQDGLDVLHVVMYPRYNFDLPILAIDVVAIKGRVTLALVDACPVRLNHSLPPYYVAVMRRLQEAILPDSLKARSVPEWGKDILSPLNVTIQPQDPEQLAAFVRYTFALTNAHLKLSDLLQPLDASSTLDAKVQEEVLACHKRFCEKNLQNKKTSRALEVAFGAEMTRDYMGDVMFDFDPEDDPAWVDAGVADLYRYMELNPPKDPTWSQEIMMEEQEKERQAALQQQKLAALLVQLAATRDKLEGLQEGMTAEVHEFLAANDPEYRGIIERVAAKMEDHDAQVAAAAQRELQQGALRAYQKWYVP